MANESYANNDTDHTYTHCGNREKNDHENRMLKYGAPEHEPFAEEQKLMDMWV